MLYIGLHGSRGHAPVVGLPLAIRLPTPFLQHFQGVFPLCSLQCMGWMIIYLTDCDHTYDSPNRLNLILECICPASIIYFGCQGYTSTWTQQGIYYTEDHIPSFAPGIWYLYNAEILTHLGSHTSAWEGGTRYPYCMSVAALESSS